MPTLVLSASVPLNTYRKGHKTRNKTTRERELYMSHSRPIEPQLVLLEVLAGGHRGDRSQVILISRNTTRQDGRLRGVAPTVGEHHKQWRLLGSRKVWGSENRSGIAGSAPLDAMMDVLERQSLGVSSRGSLLPQKLLLTKPGTSGPGVVVGGLERELLSAARVTTAHAAELRVASMGASAERAG